MSNTITFVYFLLFTNLLTLLCTVSFGTTSNTTECVPKWKKLERTMGWNAYNSPLDVTDVLACQLICYDTPGCVALDFASPIYVIGNLCFLFLETGYELEENIGVDHWVLEERCEDSRMTTRGKEN